MWDKAEITVIAGDGGDGAVSFRREKYTPLGGPYGGDGGKGGDIYLVPDPNERTLQQFSGRQLFKAGEGKDGSTKKKAGKNGRDLTIRVPEGSIVYTKSNSGGLELLADLSEASGKYMVVRGGLGGSGNARFATSINRAPRIAQRGEPGERKELVIELRLLADVGIIGLPNVGKSKLLSVISSAKPRIGDYPFTTTEPMLGIVHFGYSSHVFADIPGLIKGAHEGKGLGFEFLQHIRRCRLLLHLIAADSRDPLEDYNTICNEMELYDKSLLQKPQVIAINKIDLLGTEELEKMKKDLATVFERPIFFISAGTRQGIARMLEQLHNMLKADEQILQKEEERPPVIRPRPEEKFIIRKEKDMFIVSSPGLYRAVDLNTVETPEALAYIKKQLDRRGVTRELVKSGVKAGDKIKVGRTEIEWQWR